MLARNFAIQGPEWERLFESQLPARLARLQHRGARLRDGGWDINAVCLLAEDATFVAASCRGVGATDLADRLDHLAALVGGLLDPPQHPDVPTLAELHAALDALDGQVLPHSTTPAFSSADIAIAGPTHDHGFPLLVIPPVDYWLRFGAPAIARIATFDDEPAPAADVELESVPAVASDVPVADADAPAPAPTGLRIFLLTRGGDLADAVHARLDAQGYVTTRFARSVEMTAALGTAAPSLVLVDAGFDADLDEVGAQVKRQRKDSDHPIWLIALGEQIDVGARLHAVRIGCDALLELPASADDIVRRIADLTEAAHNDPYRIMIIEDDRSQTLFAETILRKAGMRTLAVGEALAALDQLERFRPDLILMDLYMPGCDGIDLTALIRQREAFIATPIVFLSGEHNADKHFEALHAGGDDFLSKPVRPKHLISAVTNRVRRARQQRRRVDVDVPVVTVRPLSKAQLLQRVSECLAMEDAGTRAGGLVVFAIDDFAQRLANLGGPRLGALLSDVAAFLLGHTGSRDLVATDEEGRFLVLNPDCDASLLEAYALNLRDRVARDPLSALDPASPVLFNVGVCPFVAGATQAERMLGAAQDAIDRAQTSGREGVFVVRDVEPNVDAELVDRIRFALDGSGFQLLFQPIVSLRGEEEELFQALLRLQGDDGRVHTAAEVVPVAERAGLIVALDRWVLEHCVSLIVKRTREGTAPRLFVNQSLESIRDGAGPAWLQTLLEHHEIVGTSLSIELRMSDAASAPIEMARYANELAACGATLTLSGFEAGAIGEELLQTLPFAYLKIAPRYLRLGEEAMRVELRGLVDLAHESGRRVIAPRVEDARGAAALWTAGVDFIQGNFVQQAGRDLAFDFQASVI